MSHSAVSVTSGFPIACHMSENVALTIQIFMPVRKLSCKKKVKLHEVEEEEEEKKEKVKLQEES